MNERERHFADSFFDHFDWTSQPGPFKVYMDGRYRRYTPDFYDAKRDVYIEVVGSRQALHRNKEKYKEFAKIVNGFEVRLFDTHKILDLYSPIIEQRSNKRETQSNNPYFQRLKAGFGDHSKAARHLGIDPSHYRHIRRTGRMSAGLARLIEVEANREITLAQHNDTT